MPCWGRWDKLLGCEVFFEGKSWHSFCFPKFHKTSLPHHTALKLMRRGKFWRKLLTPARLDPSIFSPQGIQAKQAVKSIRAPIAPYNYFILVKKSNPPCTSSIKCKTQQVFQSRRAKFCLHAFNIWTLPAVTVSLKFPSFEFFSRNVHKLQFFF